jgi:peptidoglycan hydrolase-like protein with peptidoglycan-binding domain
MSKLDEPEPARAAAVLSLASLAPEDVMALQRELQRRGLYPGAIDGLVGPVTTDGLIEAERRRSEREQQAIRDGHVGAALWNELIGEPPSR